MSRTQPTALERLAILEVCRVCGAGLEVWCVTTRGRAPGKRWASWLHADRLYVPQRAHQVGYTEGQADAFHGIRQEVDWRRGSTHAAWPPLVTLEQLLERTDELARTWTQHHAEATRRLP